MECKDNVVTNKITPKLHSSTKRYKVILNKEIKRKWKIQNYKKTLYDLTCHNRSQTSLHKKRVIEKSKVIKGQKIKGDKGQYKTYKSN